MWSQEEIDAGRATDQLAKERYFKAVSTGPTATDKKAGRGFWQKLKWW
jgi:hypothetical protein